MSKEIIERLARIETHVEYTAGEITLMRQSLFGNGKPGVVTRIDRLEQIEGRRRWTIRALVVASIAFFFRVVATTFGIR